MFPWRQCRAHARAGVGECRGDCESRGVEFANFSTRRVGSVPHVREKGEVSKKFERPEIRERSRLAIADRLFREGMLPEAARLRYCGEEFELVCTCCGRSKILPKSCKRRWCPDCSMVRGEVLVGKYLRVIQKMQWPLMVTLTLPHRMGNDPVEQLDQLRGGMKKLRRLTWWKKKVSGGLGAVEIAGGESGWHLHAHLLIECRWLSVTAIEPRAGMSASAIKRCFKSAQSEVAAQWALCVSEDIAHVWVKRANSSSIREALKYAVKPGTLEKIKLPLSPIIEGMKARRFVSAWGSVRKAAAAVLREEKEERHPIECECGSAEFMTGRELDGKIRSTREGAERHRAAAIAAANKVMTRARREEGRPRKK